jgi:cytoskeletal protein CcmA (bactofilin family)
MADPRESLVNSIIGAGSAVDGDIDVDGLLRIDGDVRGTIRVTGKLVVGADGRVEAPIRARSAIVGGTVKGDVYVTERLRLISGGVVIGNVFAPRFEAEEGTIVHGHVAVTGRPEGAEAELADFVAAHGDARRFLGQFREGSFAPSRGAAATAPDPAAAPGGSMDPDAAPPAPPPEGEAPEA